MTQLLQQSSAAFFMILALLSLACCVILSVAYWRREKREKGRRDRWRADIADISILFQTMRDVIGQQKALAREFNEELDTKMSLVKQVLGTSLEKNERLYERQQEVTRALEQSRGELESLQRKIADARDTLGQPAPAASRPKAAQAEPTPPPPPPPAPAPKPENVPQAYVSFDDEVPDEAEVPDADALDGTGLTGASYAKWEGLDFSGAISGAPALADEEEEADEEVFTPQAPEDAEAAREAFRALLDIGDPGDAPTPLTPEPPHAQAPRAPWDEMAKPAPKATSTGNGRDSRAALRQRVIEYHGAGMSVPEIARELGVGKGEIRLMLSLAKQRES